MIANNIARLRAGIAAAVEEWKALAARGLVIGSEKDRPVLTGSAEGVACTVRIVTDFVHNAHTEVSAEIAKGVEARIGVFPSPGGLLSAVRDWLHQDVEIGEPEFDQAFLLTAKPASAAKSLLGPETRERLCALAGGKLAGFTYAPKRATVLLNGIETDAAVLGTALDLVAHAARWTG